MISRILILSTGGILLFSKNFFVDPENEPANLLNDDLIGGFLTAINSFAKEIKGGAIKSLNFRNFNFIYSYDDRFGCMFVLITDIDDLEEDVREKVEMMKNEFIKRYSDEIERFAGLVSVFDDFDEYIDKYIFIPPKILLVGDIGVGKTTIMDLFPGETVLELDDDLIETIQKTIDISSLSGITKLLIREMNMEDLVNNSKLYRKLLDSVEVILIVTNSAASNLGRTKKLYFQLKPKIRKDIVFILANFQDLKESSFEPKHIQKSFEGVKTFGFSAIQKNSKDKLLSIITKILKTSILERYENNLKT